MAGVPLELAQDRAARVYGLHYELTLQIPPSPEDPITGSEILRFTLSGAERPLVIDFRNPPDHVLAVEANGGPSRFTVKRGQITISSASLREGLNSVAIQFVAGDGSLNRRENLMYTLFVPDRASLVLPCIDQPDLKARFSLTLKIPPSWTAVSNGSELKEVLVGDQKVVQFATTKPISTYLFAFVAGDLQVEEIQDSGFRMRLFHCETDEAKLAANLPAIFELHQKSLKWMEEYTGIAYPFGKFDFVLLPAFQFGGMEHPGAIFYRDARLLLEESATLSDKLGRANLIAHETSHMWFGDLVTMRWFDDVWLKEVFAGLMASKIVNPAFPDINHDLRFLLEHYPAAYNVERSEGTHPVRQELTNLNDSASLYGDLIYHKAPIVMRQLEFLTGKEVFRNGLQEYLSRFRFANADWLDLITILDRDCPKDLRQWSRSWVEESGRPTVWIESSSESAPRLLIRQDDPAGKNRLWQQKLTLFLSGPQGTSYLPVELIDSVQKLPIEADLDFVLPNGQGHGYGLFHLDPGSQRFLLHRLPEVEEDLSRATVWLTLWDGVLESHVSASDFTRLALKSLLSEPVELISQQVLSYLITTYWRFLSDTERNLLSEEVEVTLWKGVIQAPTTSLRSAYFKTFQAVAVSDSASGTLERVWRKEIGLPDLPLSERDYMDLALQLAVREVEAWQEILDEQFLRIESPENKAEFSFLAPSVSADRGTRDVFFDSLFDADNRSREPWVLRGLSYLHHPLRACEAVDYILPSLELLEEIKQTGTIFFPKNWLDEILAGHNSEEAARLVRDFLDGRPDYPKRLRGKILQSADLLFRSAGAKEN